MEWKVSPKELTILLLVSLTAVLFSASVFVFSFFLFVFGLYYLLCVDDVQLYYQPTLENKKILEKCGKLKSRLLLIAQIRYWPTIYAGNRHLQTLMVVMRPVMLIDFRRLYFILCRIEYETSDGGILGIDIADDYCQFDALTVILFHGVGGGSDSSYIRHFANHCKKQGIRVAAVNHRGCFDTPLKSSKMYGIVSSNDIKESIDHIKELFPTSKLIAIGYSLSSNLLSKYLGEVGKNTPLITGIGFGNPHDFEIISERAEDPIFKYSYNRKLSSRLVEYVKRHQEIFEKDSKFDLNKIKACKNWREIDLNLTIKSLNYEKLQDYYREGSSKYYIPNIQIPYLICNALDDPLIPRCSIAYQECLQSKHVILATTRCGGHLGWFEGLFPWDATWADKVALEWIDAILALSK